MREPLAYAAEQLWQRGVTVVAAAGNQADGTGRLDLPAADPFLIAVGASDTGGTAETGRRHRRRLLLARREPRRPTSSRPGPA